LIKKTWIKTINSSSTKHCNENKAEKYIPWIL